MVKAEAGSFGMFLARREIDSLFLVEKLNCILGDGVNTFVMFHVESAGGGEHENPSSPGRKIWWSILYIVAPSLARALRFLSVSLQVHLGWWAELKLPFSPGK